MKPPPSPFQSLLLAPTFALAALLLSGTVLWFFGELGFIPLTVAFLLFCGLAVRNAIRRLDEVEGPFPRPNSQKNRDA